MIMDEHAWWRLPSICRYFVFVQLKQMEVQLEEEYDEKQKVLKEKRELDSKLLSAQDKVTAAWCTKNRMKGDVSDITLKPLIDTKFIPFSNLLKRNYLPHDGLHYSLWRIEIWSCYPVLVVLRAPLIRHADCKGL